ILMTAFSFAACERITSSSSSNSSAMTDSDLEKMIKTKLDADPQLKAADISVTANAAQNEATLSGTVDSEALRTRAVEMARASRSALLITDKIDVKPREVGRAQYTEDEAKNERAKAHNNNEQVGSSLDDAWIHAKVVAKLIGNSNTPERKINV